MWPLPMIPYMFQSQVTWPSWSCSNLFIWVPPAPVPLPYPHEVLIPVSFPYGDIPILSPPSHMGPPWTFSNLFNIYSSFDNRAVGFGWKAFLSENSLVRILLNITKILFKVGCLRIVREGPKKLKKFCPVWLRFRKLVPSIINWVKSYLLGLLCQN